MKHINLDKVKEEIRAFIQSLSKNSAGSILELGGKPFLKVLPVTDEAIDPTKVKEAIRNRRDESRALNKEWEAVDQEMWDKSPDTES
jgi:hypothetical protein